MQKKNIIKETCTVCKPQFMPRVEKCRYKYLRDTVRDARVILEENPGLFCLFTSALWIRFDS